MRRVLAWSIRPSMSSIISATKTTTKTYENDVIQSWYRRLEEKKIIFHLIFKAKSEYYNIIIIIINTLRSRCSIGLSFMPIFASRHVSPFSPIAPPSMSGSLSLSLTLPLWVSFKGCLGQISFWTPQWIQNILLAMFNRMMPHKLLQLFTSPYFGSLINRPFFLFSSTLSSSKIRLQRSRRTSSESSPAALIASGGILSSLLPSHCWAFL